MKILGVIIGLMALFFGHYSYADSDVEQKPCDIVSYLVIWDPRLDMKSLPEKWSTENIKFPLYVGYLCIDTMKKAITFHKKYEDCPWNYHVTNQIEEVNSSDTFPFILDFSDRFPEDTARRIEEYEAKKDAKHFPLFTTPCCSWGGATAIRLDENAVPDPLWEPQFSQQITYAEMRAISAKRGRPSEKIAAIIREYEGPLHRTVPQDISDWFFWQVLPPQKQ